MEFVIQREPLLKSLQTVVGVVEKKQSFPILSNILLNLNDNCLSFTATDLEIELITYLHKVNNSGQINGQITVPARRLVDICRSLPEGAQLHFSLTQQRLLLSSGNSRFTLLTLPAGEFPRMLTDSGAQEFSLPQQDLKKLIEKTHFSMAQQDVRYYLNGMFFEILEGSIRTVATDGHRLATSCCTISTYRSDTPARLVVPRKAILELYRLLADSPQEVKVIMGDKHIIIHCDEFSFTSKLINGRFPDYNRIIPQGSDKCLIGSRDLIKQALSRVAIICEEKTRLVNLIINNHLLKLSSKNVEQEAAEEEVTVDYNGSVIEAYFNVNYLLEVMNVINAENIRIIFFEKNSSIIIENLEQDNSIYVVMPVKV